MAKIIIGIHGLGNKPPRKVLRKWWIQSIHDGLKRIGRDRLFFRFEMVYWADIMHKEPLDPAVKDKENSQYLDDPYVPPSGEYENKPNNLRKKLLDFIEKQLDGIFLNDDLTVNYSRVTDIIIHHFFVELDTYFSTNGETGPETSVSVKEATDRRLEAILRKHKGKDILLVSHSMGTIIAYHVLTTTGDDIPVDTLVTMGSPLGLPAIMGKIAEDHSSDGQKPEVRTPEHVVHKWYNFSDLEDKIAFNYTLGDDYMENSGHVRATDVVVHNDYTIDGKRNPHKSYGYLRTAELAQVIDDFLTGGRRTPGAALLGWLKQLFAR